MQGPHARPSKHQNTCNHPTHALLDPNASNPQCGLLIPAVPGPTGNLTPQLQCLSITRLGVSACTVTVSIRTAQDAAPRCAAECWACTATEPRHKSQAGLHTRPQHPRSRAKLFPTQVLSQVPVLLFTKRVQVTTTSAVTCTAIGSNHHAMLCTTTGSSDHSKCYEVLYYGFKCRTPMLCSPCMSHTLGQSGQPRCNSNTDKFRRGAAFAAAPSAQRPAGPAAAERC